MEGYHDMESIVDHSYTVVLMDGLNVYLPPPPPTSHITPILKFLPPSTHDTSKAPRLLSNQERNCLPTFFICSQQPLLQPKA